MEERATHRTAEQEGIGKQGPSVCDQPREERFPNGRRFICVRLEHGAPMVAPDQVVFS